MGTEDAHAGLGALVTGVSHGGTSVTRAHAETRRDEDGRPYVLLVLSLTEPQDGRDTWPVEDTFEIRQRVRRIVDELGMTMPVDLSLTVDGPDDSAEGDTQSQGSAGAGGSAQ